MTAAIFLDKDGTLVRDVPYNVDPAKIALASGAGEALSLFTKARYALFVVSNQSGVARGLFAEESLVAVERRLRELVERAGARLAGFYYCPHHPQAAVAQFAVRCGCRKPLPGMLERAAAEHAIDLRASWMVGDILDDVEAGQRAGCRTAMILNGGETLWERLDERTPDVVASNLASAARRICVAPRSTCLRKERTRCPQYLG